MFVLLLAGCSHDDTNSKPTQVVAKVNGDEITVHQLNSEIRRVQVSTANPQDLAKKLLTGLIDRQLLVQEAYKLNLDRTPEVMQMLDAAKAQIYVQAYLTQKLAALSEPSELEVSRFMKQHPEVFSQRKVFTTQDIIFSNDPKVINYEQLQSSVSNMEELKTWLNAHQVSFEMAEENLPTEALPREALLVVNKIKVGDLLFMRDESKIVAHIVINIAELPLPDIQARDMASKAVSENKRQQLILGEIGRLKKLAKIEIVDPELVYKEAPENVVTERASQPAAEDANPHMDKGLKGL